MTPPIATPFDVLAEPSRRNILDLLLVSERPVSELVAETAMSQPAVSKHLRVLREAGLVSVRTDAQRRIYRVRVEPLRDIDDWLRPYRQLWSSRLDALEHRLDTMQRLDMADPEVGDAPPAARRRTAE
jgi:DNA-binding transcriptional ArsR family regulator